MFPDDSRHNPWSSNRVFAEVITVLTAAATVLALAALVALVAYMIVTTVSDAVLFTIGLPVP